jgi:hypothetical protein
LPANARCLWPLGADGVLATVTGSYAPVELERAGEGAKAAAEADPGVSPTAPDAIVAAHLAICTAEAKGAARSSPPL